MTDPTWRALFVHPQHPWRDYEETLPLTGDVPPAAIRRPGRLAGMPAVDVYLLSDSEPWPASSRYTYIESLLGGLEDHRPPEYCLDLGDRFGGGALS